MSVELFRRAADYAREVMSGLSSDDLQRPTPCTGWDARRVLLHLADTADALVGLTKTGELRLPESPRIDHADPVAVVHESLDELLATLSTTSDAQRADDAAQAGAIEFTVHGWDIGVASNQSHRVPERLAGDVLALASSLISDDARGANFAARADAPTDAPTSDRLAAFLGRQRVGD